MNHKGEFMNIKYEKTKLFICMAAVMLLYTFTSIQGYPLHTSTDELGVMAGAAHLAGLDWSGVISQSGYYGFGWSSLFFWLFKITDNPIVIYRIMIIANIFVRLWIIPIAFYIGKEYLHITNTKVLYLSAVLMIFINCKTVSTANNESIYELLIWILMLLLCKIQYHYDNAKKRMLYIALTYLTALYALSIHTRALTIFIAVTIVLVGYSFIKKNWKLVLTIIAAALVVYVIAKILVTQYQAQVYGTNEHLRNAEVQISSRLPMLISNLKTWEVWLHVMIGMSGAENIISGGIFIVCATALIFYIKKVACGQIQMNPTINIILVVSILCIGATVMAFCVMDGAFVENMVSVWKEQGMERSYSYKGLTYIRYWNVYLPPVILCVTAMLEQMEYEKIFNDATLISVGLYMGFVCCIVPLIQENGAAFTPLQGIGGYRFGDSVNKNDYYVCILYSIFILLLVYLLIHTRFRQFYLLPIIMLTVFSLVRETCEFDVPVKEAMSSKITASYYEKCGLEKRGTDIGQIYLYDTPNEDGNWQIYSVAQFYFNRYTLHIGLPEKMEDQDIIISSIKIEEIEKRYEDIICYELDENEYWYTRMRIE